MTMNQFDFYKKKTKEIFPKNLMRRIRGVTTGEFK